MTLLDYVRLLRRRAALILLTTLVVTAGALAYSSQQPKVYASSAQLIISVAATPVEGVASRPIAAEQAEALARIANTPPALEAAADAAGVPVGGLTAEATADAKSPFLDVRVTGRDPSSPAAVANAFAETLPQVAADLDQIDSSRSVRLIPVRPAVAGEDPVSPRPVRDGVTGLVVGLVLGVGLAYLVTALDRQVRDSGEIEDATGLVVLGAVPLELAHEPLPARTEPASSRAEAYRLIRTNLQFTDNPTRPRTVLVTSPAPGDGKTTLAANLAVSCAQAGERTVVVDGDLRRPRLGRQFGLVGGPGLAELLAAGGERDLDEYLHRVSDAEPSGVAQALWVLPSGLPPRNPSELLGRPAFSALLRRLALRFDRVIVDAPPVLAVADGLRMSTSVAGVLVVARVDKTTVDDLTNSRKRLEKASATVFGVVANGVLPARDRAYGYGSYGDEVYGDAAYGELAGGSPGQPSRFARRSRRRRTT